MQDVQVSMESAQGLERRIRIQVPAARVHREVEARLKSVSRTANLKGFRPGKVPESVIRKRFGDQVRREVVQDLVQSSYAEALAREKLRPAGDPRIDLPAEPGAEGADLTYTASLEVFPEFEVQGLGGIAVNRPEPAIDDGDLDFVLENIRRQRAHWHGVSRPAKLGDRVTVTVKGIADGKPAPGAGEKLAVVLGTGHMSAELEQQMVGQQAGEERTLKFTAQDSAGGAVSRASDILVRMDEVSEEHLPEVDEQFIRGFGVDSGSRDEFLKSIRDYMQQEFDSRSRAEVKRQLLDHLVRMNPITVPAVLVDNEAASLQADAARTLGTDARDQLPPVDAYRDTAERRVRLGLVIGAIIREKGLTVDAGRVRGRVEELASAYDNPEEVKSLYYQTAQLMTQVENSVMEEQVIEWLTGQAAVTPVPTSFRSLAGR